MVGIVYDIALGFDLSNLVMANVFQNTFVCDGLRNIFCIDILRSHGSHLWWPYTKQLWKDSFMYQLCPMAYLDKNHWGFGYAWCSSCNSLGLVFCSITFYQFWGEKEIQFVASKSLYHSYFLKDSHKNQNLV